MHIHKRYTLIHTAVILTLEDRNIPNPDEIALDVLKRLNHGIIPEDVKPTVTIYLDEVNERFSEVTVSYDQVMSRSHKREIVEARQWIHWAFKNFTGLSLRQIGILTGGHDHSTVIHSCNVIDDLCSYDKRYKSFRDYLLNRYGVNVTI